MSFPIKSRMTIAKVRQCPRFEAKEKGDYILYKQAARDLECDPDEKRWEDKLCKVVKHKPVEKPSKIRF